MSALASVLFIIFIIVGVYSSSNLNTKELQMVHVIARHGIRTPVDTYPTDPYLNYTFHPVGWGQLTNEGKSDLFHLGKDIRERYNKFLGDLYMPNIYYSQATDVDRTIASIQLINAGIWEPKHDQIWSQLNWQPIPVHYEPLNNDMLLLVRKPCAQYELELQKVVASIPVQEKIKMNHIFFDELEDWTGKAISNFDDLQDLYTTLAAEKAFNLTLPSWTEGVFPEKMYDLTAFSYQVRAYNAFLTKFKGGVLLKKIINDWIMKIDGSITPKERKFFLFGGHDSTIANLLSALKIFEPHVPDYAATVILELSKDKITKTYGIEVFYRKSVDYPLRKIKIPHCDDFCPLQDFLQLSLDVIPKDWESECHTDDQNFVVPEPLGP